MNRLRILRDEAGRIRRDETGSALLLALIFLLFTSIVITGVLTFTDTSFRTTIAVRDQGDEIYAADAAIDAAINYVRERIDQGRVGEPCLAFKAPSFNGVTATVTCEGDTGSGALPAGHVLNHPELAVLILTSGSASPVIDGYRQGSVGGVGNALRIKGGFWSNNNIRVDVNNASLKVSGTVIALNGCQNPSQVTALTLECNGSTASPTVAPRTAPAYPMEVSVPPAPGVLPDCSLFPLSSFIPISPGSYSDSSALSAITNPTGGSACANKVIWFQPGVYYFNFANSGSHVWRINTGPKDGRADVIAGTPNTATGLPTSTVTNFPGSCKDDAFRRLNLITTAIPGVQFIFGGDSQLSIEGGETEICATSHPAAQQIAIFGVTQTTAVAPVAITTKLTAVTATSTSSTTSTAFTSPNNARDIQESPSDLLSLANLTQTLRNASVTLTGFSSTIPAGSTIGAVELQVRHKDTSRIAKVTATVSHPGGSTVIRDDATGNCSGLDLHNNMSTDAVNLKTCAGLDTLAELNGGVTVTYTVQKDATSNSTTEDLDGAVLSVTYTPPASGFQAQSGGVIAGDNAPVFNASGNDTGMSIHGSIHTPLSGADITLNNASAEVIDRGIIVRFLRAAITGSSGFTGIPISLPDDPFADRTVVFKASVNGRLRSRAVVLFNDACDPSPCEVGQAVTVKSWSVVR